MEALLGVSRLRESGLELADVTQPESQSVCVCPRLPT